MVQPCILLIAASTFDRVASGTLAKVEEKLPIITKTPTEVRLPFLNYCSAQGFLEHTKWREDVAKEICST